MMDEFESRVWLHSAEEVLNLSRIFLEPELNNVVEGFKKHFYGITLTEQESLESYILTYVGNYNKLEGFYLRTGRHIKDRDIMTLRFSKIIEQTFPENNQLVVFNTFQSKLTELYETFGIICVPEHIANLQNACLFMPTNKSSVDHLLRVNILEFYRSLFKREKLAYDVDGEPKVYLMYDRREDKIKIGETRKKLQTRRKGVAEPTKRAIDPMIEILTAWKAPKNIEDELHAYYEAKRVRGEYFDLRASDLEKIDLHMKEYDMIDFRA